MVLLSKFGSDFEILISRITLHDSSMKIININGSLEITYDLSLVSQEAIKHREY